MLFPSHVQYPKKLSHMHNFHEMKLGWQTARVSQIQNGEEQYCATRLLQCSLKLKILSR